MSDVSVAFTGNASSVIKAYEKQIEKQADAIAKLKAMKEASKDVGNEVERSLGRKARRIIEDLQTPLEKYLAKHKEIKQMARSGLLDAEQYRRATVQAKAYFHTQVENSKKAVQQNRLAGDEVKRLSGKYEEAERKAREVAASNNAAFGPKMLSDLRGIAGAMGLGTGIAGALDLIISKSKTALEVAKEAFEVTRNFASTEELTTLNLASLSPSEQDDFLKEITAMSERLDISELSLHKRFQTAVSSREGASLEDTLKTVEASYGYSRKDDEAGQAATSFGLGMVNRGWSPEEGMGLLQMTGKVSKIEDPRLLSQYVAPALMRGLQAGFSEQEASGLFGAISTGLVDRTGERTKTAINSLLDSVSTYKLKGDEEVPGATTEDKLRWLIANKKKGSEFVEKASLGESRSMFREFFKSGTPYQNFERNVTELPSQEKLGEFFRTSSEMRYNTKPQRVARVGDRLDTRMENLLKSQDENRQKAAKYYEEFDKWADMTGTTSVGKQVYKTKLWMQGGDLEDTIGAYENLRQGLGSKMYGVGASRNTDGSWNKGWLGSSLDATERADAQKTMVGLDKTIAEMKRLGDLMEKNNRLLEQQGEFQQQTAANTTRSPVLDNNDHD